MPSTAIGGLSYNAANGELSVTFVSGRRYIYQNVPHDVFLAFSGASSRGRFFNQHIRDRYRYREVPRDGWSQAARH